MFFGIRRTFGWCEFKNSWNFFSLGRAGSLEVFRKFFRPMVCGAASCMRIPFSSCRIFFEKYAHRWFSPVCCVFAKWVVRTPSGYAEPYICSKAYLSRIVLPILLLQGLSALCFLGFRAYRPTFCIKSWIRCISVL